MHPTLRRTACVVAIALSLSPLTATRAAGSSGDHLVDPFVGTGGDPPWLSGSTTPAAARPFGLVQLGPDTTTDADTGAPSRTASGYSSDDPLLRGFSPTHLSGAGCSTFGDAPVLPVVGGVPTAPAAATVAIDRASERAAPGRYAVTLANGVRASMAAALRGGLLRFAYPAGGRARVLVKGAGSLAGTSAARVRFPSDREVAVRATSGGFCGAANTYVVHVLYRFDSAFRSTGRWGPGGAWLDFGRDPLVRARVGVSFVDAAGARGNLEASRLGWSVGDLAADAASAWDRELDRVEVSGGTVDERRTFDTALYHAVLHPSTVSDADRRYPGFDGRVHRLRAGERQLSAIAGWDFYRTHLPLLAWLRPDVASQVVRSLLRDARQGGSLPRWALVGSETGIMNGDSAAPTVATAYAFGARDVPLPELVTRLAHQGDTTRPGVADYLHLGYVPDPRVGASTTLEYATDDFAVSRLAAAAGRTAVAQRYRARSGSWRALLDPERGLLLPRDAAGAFPPPEADVTACCPGFEEGNAAQYTWSGVPQDVAGLMAALGDPAATAERLDDFFTRLNHGANGASAWLGNQPSLAAPWTYHWLGRPARTQDVVARARAELWSATDGGLPGNDDLGALSAWYVWTSLGLYPLTPGTANVAVGVPAFPEVVVRPTQGPATRIVRSGTGAHVGGVEVDGADRTASWLGLGPGVRPGRLVVATTGDEAPAWGTGPGDAPPSYRSE